MKLGQMENSHLFVELKKDGSINNDPEFSILLAKETEAKRNCLYAHMELVSFLSFDRKRDSTSLLRICYNVFREEFIKQWLK